jgi:membrane-bound ClpP family serine protease
MWIVAGVLLGVVVLASLVGFHTGPHTHVVAGVCGVIAAIWLVAMALNGRSTSLVWTLFSADVVVSAGVGVMGWYGLSHRATGSSHLGRLEGAEAIAVSDLAPDGIVRVRGEQWSAHCVNGTVAAGTRVQVLQASGVHLEVWGEEAADALPGAMGQDAPAELNSKEKNG